MVYNHFRMQIAIRGITAHAVPARATAAIDKIVFYAIGFSLIVAIMAKPFRTINGKIIIPKEANAVTNPCFTICIKTSSLYFFKAILVFKSVSIYRGTNKSNVIGLKTYIIDSLVKECIVFRP